MSEIRWYKGKYKVEIVLKSKGNYRVRALENTPLQNWQQDSLSGVPFRAKAPKGTEFTTVPRLLWRHPRQ